MINCLIPVHSHSDTYGQLRVNSSNKPVGQNPGTNGISCKLNTQRKPFSSKW